MGVQEPWTGVQGACHKLVCDKEEAFDGLTKFGYVCYLVVVLPLPDLGHWVTQSGTCVNDVRRQEVIKNKNSNLDNQAKITANKRAGILNKSVA
jgi:hypothetical protein